VHQGQFYKTTDIVKKIDRCPRRGSVPVREHALTSVGESVSADDLKKALETKVS
jgi:hypothetical protein